MSGQAILAKNNHFKTMWEHVFWHFSNCFQFLLLEIVIIQAKGWDFVQLLCLFKCQSTIPIDAFFRMTFQIHRIQLWPIGIRIHRLWNTTHHAMAVNAPCPISGHNAFSSHVDRDGHVDCLQQCHPTIRSMPRSTGRDVVSWLNNRKTLSTKPWCQVLPLADFPTSQHVSQSCPTLCVRLVRLQSSCLRFRTCSWACPLWRCSASWKGNYPIQLWFFMFCGMLEHLHNLSRISLIIFTVVCPGKHSTRTQLVLYRFQTILCPLNCWKYRSWSCHFSLASECSCIFLRQRTESECTCVLAVDHLITLSCNKDLIQGVKCHSIVEKFRILWFSSKINFCVMSKNVSWCSCAQPDSNCNCLQDVLLLSLLLT